MDKQDTIQVNRGYRILNVMRDMPPKLAFVCGRQGNTISVLLVSGIATSQVLTFEQEFAQIKDPAGGNYNLFPRNKVTDMHEVAEICEMIRRSE